MSKHQKLNETLAELGLSIRRAPHSIERRILQDGEVVFQGTAQDTWQWLRDSGRLPYLREPSPRQKINQAMRDPDRWVCRIVYQDRGGKFTSRLISPERWTGDEMAFLALCLGREDQRHFSLSGVKSVTLVNAADVLMGDEPVESISRESGGQE